MARKPHKPTDESRRNVKALTAYGIQQEAIGEIIGVSVPTLHKYYRHELDTGAEQANAKVAESLYNQAIGGNVTAAIFWAKTRMGWKEAQGPQTGHFTVEVVKFSG